MKNEYKVSVITPFHNVEIEYFRKTVKSMQEQTLGFENIEWIIVFHNCEQSYIDDAMSLVKDFENVRTDIISNDVHSPSSPRNHALKMVTSPYVGFLDADDSYKPWCLKTALFHMEDTGAEITWFRIEYELEDPNNYPLREIVLWNQTYDRIVLERGKNWDYEKMFSGVWGMVTTRLYSMEFLRNNDIWFDEEVAFAEDGLFNLNAYGYVSKLCYLPQMIGYHYYIHGGSLFQSGEKTPEQIVDMAYGMTRIFDMGYKNGFFMDAIVGDMTVFLMMRMMTSGDIPVEIHQKVKELVEPYLNLASPIKVSKLYNEKDVSDRYYGVRDYFLNPEKWGEYSLDESMLSDRYDKYAMSDDMRLIQYILEQNVSTDYGKRYGFADIRTVSGFQSIVPLSNYKILSPLVSLTANIGESSIYVKEPVKYYIHFLDENYELGMIPATASHLVAYLDVVESVCKGHATFLLIDGIYSRHTYNDQSSSQSICAAVMQEYIDKFYRTKRTDGTKIITPSRSMCEENKDGYYIRVLFALADEGLTHIFAANSYSLLRLINYILKMKDVLCRDIEQGTVSGSPDLENSNDIFTLKANPERAQLIKSVLEKASEQNSYSLKDIWPALSMITSYDVGEYEYYTKKLSIFAEGIYMQAIDMIPEAMVGLPGKGSWPFLLNRKGAFFELGHVDKTDAPKELILPKDATVGSVYRLYVTNMAGLYRYDTERFIRICEKNPEGNLYYEPAPDFKRGLQLDKLWIDEEKLRSVTQLLESRIQHDILNYVFAAENGRLIAFLEFLRPEKENTDLIDQAGKALDEILCEEFSDYLALRDSASIESPLVRILSAESIHLFAELKAYKNKVAPDSVRPFHVAVRKEDIAFMQSISEE